MSIKRLEKLKNKARRDLFVAGQIKTGIPFQVRSLRDKTGWTQAQLGAELGMTQTNVSRLESPGYGRLNITTLQRIASVFDVALIVGFVPFSELFRWTNNLTTEAMAPASFDEEVESLEKEATSVVTTYAQPVRVSPTPGTATYHVADASVFCTAAPPYYMRAGTIRDFEDIIVTWEEPSKDATETAGAIEETEAPTSLIDLLKPLSSDTNVIDYAAHKAKKAA